MISGDSLAFSSAASSTGTKGRKCHIPRGLNNYKMWCVTTCRPITDDTVYKKEYFPTYDLRTGRIELYISLEIFAFTQKLSLWICAISKNMHFY